MKYVLFRSALAIFFAALLACNDGRSDPLTGDNPGTGGFGGQLTQGRNGLNKTVDEEYKYLFCQELIPLVFQSNSDGIYTLNQAPESGDSLRNVRVIGLFYGYATVNGLVEVPEDNSTLNAYLTVTYYDYSDSGSLFLGGHAVCALHAARQNGVWLPGTLRLLNGSVVFAGNFTGSVTFDSLDVPLAGNGRPFSVFATMKQMNFRQASGDLTTQSGGTVLNDFNPYYRRAVIGGYLEPPPPPPL